MPPVRVYLTAAANLKKADFNLGWHCASFLIWQIALLYNILGTMLSECSDRIINNQFNHIRC